MSMIAIEAMEQAVAVALATQRAKIVEKIRHVAAKARAAAVDAPHAIYDVTAETAETLADLIENDEALT